jgi:hypothetical protein
LRRRPRETPELLAATGWAAATWLVYAVTSTNHSGVCLSVRWFVPLAAPGGLVLAVLLRERPAVRPGFLVLASGGVVLGTIAACYGPWVQHMVPGFWFIVGLTLSTWGVVAWRNGKKAPAPAAEPEVRQAA